MRENLSELWPWRPNFGNFVLRPMTKGAASLSLSLCVSRCGSGGKEEFLKKGRKGRTWYEHGFETWTVHRTTKRRESRFLRLNHDDIIINLIII